MTLSLVVQCVGRLMRTAQLVFSVWSRFGVGFGHDGMKSLVSTIYSTELQNLITFIMKKINIKLDNFPSHSDTGEQ